RRAGSQRVLDLGCGNGAFCHELAARGFEAVGCDPSETGIRVARATVPDVTFFELGVHDDPARLETAPFDAVVAIEVVEHLYLPRQLPEFARRVLKPDGHLIVTTPYHGYLKNLALSLLGRWDAHWSPLWDGGHIKFWSVDTLRALVEPVGFEFESFVGVGRLPGFWKSMVLVFRVGEPRRLAV
ncbi:MAG TPA: class I SAM-dependent methyltransferase, partial [Vicinamibacterales bacterium]|nr:class I SAM-dependent methyltransferase [Vicinamibacterales bacterium]